MYAEALRGGVQKGIAVPTPPAQEHAEVFPFDKNELSVRVCARARVLPRCCLHVLRMCLVYWDYCLYLNLILLKLIG